MNTGKGLSLSDDYPALLLQRHDRIEAWSGMEDIADFERLSVFPVRVLFWRSKEETLCRRRCPLFSPEIGIVPDKICALDWLHGLSLGVWQTYCSYTLHRLVAADAWLTNSKNQQIRMGMVLAQMSPELDKWLQAQRKTGKSTTDVGVLRPEQFGTFKKPLCSLKAGQTNWFLQYLVEVALPPRLHFLGSDAADILKAGQSSLKILEIIRSHPRGTMMSACAIQSFHREAKTYLQAMEDLRVVAKPKDHMLMEMSDRLGFMGSPSLYGNWLDESLNRLLRDVASAAHSSVHDRRVLCEFAKAHSKSHQRGSKRRID